MDFQKRGEEKERENTVTSHYTDSSPYPKLSPERKFAKSSVARDTTEQFDEDY
jgi:hypothetical protein